MGGGGLEGDGGISFTTTDLAFVLITPTIQRCDDQVLKGREI